MSNPTDLTLLASVIIPTYNRADHLLECLQHLAAQTCRAFEVILVDDGSTDDTAVRVQAWLLTSPFPLHFLQQQNAGPARARNLAISHIHSPLCIMIGDDTFPDPNFITAHVDFHRSYPHPQAAAVGLTRWAEHGQVVTPLMRWLDQEGVQFGYRALLAGKKPDYRYFYTSNLSLKSAFLGQNPFNEGFPNAGIEDIELGYRLTVEHGLDLHFLATAVTEHLHPVTFDSTCRRALMVGGAMYQFEQLWPAQRPAPPAFKTRALNLLAEEHVLLPILAAVARLVTPHWCPNPFLARTIQLHGVLGHRKEARKADKQAHPST